MFKKRKWGSLILGVAILWTSLPFTVLAEQEELEQPVIAREAEILNQEHNYHLQGGGPSNNQDLQNIDELVEGSKDEIISQERGPEEDIPQQGIPLEFKGPENKLLEKAIRKSIGGKLLQENKITQNQFENNSYPITRHKIDESGKVVEIGNIIYLTSIQGFNHLKDEYKADDIVYPISCNGLEYADNLIKFDMAGFQVKDLESLPKNLQYLSLGGPGRVDQDPKDSKYLDKIVDYSYFDETNCQWLNGMDKLEIVRFPNCKLTNVDFLKPLKDHDSIMTLTLTNNEIEDVSIFKDFNRIPARDPVSASSGLFMTHNKIADLSPLGKHRHDESDNTQQVTVKPDAMEFSNPLKSYEGNYKIAYENKYVNKEYQNPTGNERFSTTGENNELIRIHKLPTDGTLLTTGISESGGFFTIDCSNLIEDTNQEVKFGAAYIEEKIKSMLDIDPQDSVTKSDLLRLDKLYIKIKSGETSIEGLQFAKNIKELTFTRWASPSEPGSIKDIHLIEELENLEELDITGCNLENINFLKDFKSKDRLKKLNLSLNNITDISILENYPELTRLNISANRITDLSPLKELKDKLGYNLTYHNNGPYLFPTKREFINPMKDFDGKTEPLKLTDEDKTLFAISDDNKIISYKGSLPINKEFTIYTETLDRPLRINPKNMEEVKQEVFFVIQGYQGETYIESITEPSIKIWKGTTQENEVVQDDTEQVRIWHLPAGEYNYEISAPGYKNKTGSFTVGEDDLRPVINLEYEKEDSFPVIKSFELIDRASKRTLGKGEVEGDKVFVTVKNENDRDLIYNGKSTIKAEFENATYVDIWAHASPLRKDVYHSSYSAEALNGQSWTSFNINPSGMTTLWVKGNNGLELPYRVAIKEKEEQNVVMFSTDPDGNPASLGLLQVPTGSGQNMTFDVNATVQLVNPGEKALDLLDYVNKITGYNAKLEKTGGIFEGWYTSPQWLEKFDIKNTIIDKTYVLYPKFSNSSTLGKYPNPFTVWIDGPGTNMGFQGINNKDILTMYYGKDEPTKEYTSPTKTKVEKVGDPFTFKFDIKEPYALSYLFAEYGRRHLPINHVGNNTFNYTPGPSQDTSYFSKNTIFYNIMDKEYSNNIPFDIEKQHKITVVSEGPDLHLDYLTWSIPVYNSLGHEGYTIPFGFKVDDIEEVKVKTATDKDVDVSERNNSENKRIKDAKHSYSFIMPNEDVTIYVKGSVPGKEVTRSLRFNIVDTEGNPVDTKKIQCLELSNDPYFYKLDDITKPLNVKFYSSGTSYSYTLYTDLGLFLGDFFLKLEDSEEITITIDPKDALDKKTKEDYEKILKLAKSKLKEKEKYTEESLAKLDGTIKDVEQQVKLQADYTGAHRRLALAIDELVEIKKPDDNKPGDDNNKPDDGNKPEDNKPVDDNKDDDKKDPVVTVTPKESLQSLVNSLDTIKQGNYSKETWDVFQKALKDAKDLLKNSGATEKDLKDAKDALNKAYAALKEKEESKIDDKAKAINEAQKKLEAESRFWKMTDVEKHWAKDVIKYVMDRGYFLGTSGTTFSPNRAATRAEFITVLGRRAKIDVKSYTKNKMKDVPAGVYYEPYVNWAVEKGIIQGVGNDYFEPNRAMTREEMATILDRYLLTVGGGPREGSGKVYADEDNIASWAKTSIDRLSRQGLLQGRDYNKFAPKADFTRAEVAQVIYNLDTK